MHYMTREERMLKLNSLCNVRDLGGYETQDGHYTKANKYVRSASLYGMSVSDRRKLFDHGVKVVIDLRSEYEMKKQPDPLKEMDAIEYYHIDMFNDPNASLTSNKRPFNNMGDLYCIMLDECKTTIKQVFDVFLNHPYDCILFHCSAGKDRTGVIAALLLDLAGCHEYDIVKDYSESFENNLPIYEMLKQLASDEDHLESNPTFMMKMLNHLRDEYGSSQIYLRALGYSDDEIDDLKNIFIL